MTTSATYPISMLQDLIGVTIVRLGIGGYIPATEYVTLHNPMSAEEFAHLSYATDMMPYHFQGSKEALNIAHAPQLIADNDFGSRRHFNDVIGMFHAHFQTEEPILFK